MTTELVIVGIAMLVGCGAVVYMVLRLLGAVLSAVYRTVRQLCGLNNFPARDASAGVTFARGGVRVCANPGCRRVEYRDARYCPQCGARLN